jgi:ribosomal-protein-alanine N-acetyltransferase
MLANDIFFGFAWAADSVEGFIICRTVCDEAEIITLCVIPQFRKRGAGKALLAKAEDCAKNRSARKMFLEVAEDNVAAQ